MPYSPENWHAFMLGMIFSYDITRAILFDTLVSRYLSRVFNASYKQIFIRDLISKAILNVEETFLTAIFCFIHHSDLFVKTNNQQLILSNKLYILFDPCTTRMIIIMNLQLITCLSIRHLNA